MYVIHVVTVFVEDNAHYTSYDKITTSLWEKPCINPHVPIDTPVRIRKHSTTQHLN